MSNSKIIESSWPPGQLGAPIPQFQVETQPILSPFKAKCFCEPSALARPLHARQNERRALLRTPVAIGDVMVGSTVSQVEISYIPTLQLANWC